MPASGWPRPLLRTRFTGIAARRAVLVIATVPLSILLPTLLPTLAVRADESGGQVLRFPGHPTDPLPPGVHAFGLGQEAPVDGAGGGQRPGASHDFARGFGQEFRQDHDEGGLGRERASGRAPSGTRLAPGQRAAAPKPKPPTPQEKQAEIRKALTPPPPLAVARRRSLDELYAKLAAAKDADEARSTASVIAGIWMHSSSDTATLLMARAEHALEEKNVPLALAVLDRLVTLQPDWAEAWNKRATVRYLAGNLNGAMADVDRVLKLEPNHFAALNGMALILQRTGFDKRALQVYRRELSIYPHQPQVEHAVEELATAVEGQGI